MIQSHPPFRPQLNFFGSTVQDGEREIFAGHVFLQTDEAGFPGRRMGMGNLTMPRLPALEKKRRGRPIKTAAYITLLAHCEMARELAPAGSSVKEIRCNALQAIVSATQARPEEWARDRIADGEGRLLQIQMKKARDEVVGMKKCLVMSRSAQTGFWMALEKPPVEKNGIQVIDSHGWLCFAGATAEYGRIRWECPGAWAKK